MMPTYHVCDIPNTAEGGKSKRQSVSKEMEGRKERRKKENRTSHDPEAGGEERGVATGEEVELVVRVQVIAGPLSTNAFPRVSLLMY